MLLFAIRNLNTTEELDKRGVRNCCGRVPYLLKRNGSFNDECRNLRRLVNSYFSEDTHVACSLTREMPVPARAQPPSPHPSCRETKSQRKLRSFLRSSLPAGRSDRRSPRQGGPLSAPCPEKRKLGITTLASLRR